MVSKELNFIDEINGNKYIEDLKQIISELDALIISLESRK